MRSKIKIYLVVWFLMACRCWTYAMASARFFRCSLVNSRLRYVLTVASLIKRRSAIWLLLSPFPNNSITSPSRVLSEDSLDLWRNSSTSLLAISGDRMVSPLKMLLTAVGISFILVSFRINPSAPNLKAWKRSWSLSEMEKISIFV